MPAIDQENILWESKALTTSADSDNTYDTGGAGLDPSVGEPLCLVVTVEVAAAVAGTETYQFGVSQSENADLSSDDLLCSVAFTTAQAAALLTAGAQFQVPIPAGSVTKQYLGCAYVSANSAAITVTCRIAAVKDVPNIKTFPKNYTVA